MRDGLSARVRKPAGVFFLYTRPMKISAQLAMWLCAAFALACLGFAFSGFAGLATMTDQAERDLTAGYAWFWMFLAVVAVVFGVLSWMIKQGKFGSVD